MPDLSSARMVDERAHYPASDRAAKREPYLSVIAPDAQANRRELTFEYKIRYQLRRQHFNPPLFQQSHVHVFGIEITFQAVCGAADLYGIDIIEHENKLQNWAERLPSIINEFPLLPIGTTEDMCWYFSQIPTEERVKVLAVAIDETPERTTILRVGNE